MLYLIILFFVIGIIVAILVSKSKQKKKNDVVVSVKTLKDNNVELFPSNNEVVTQKETAKKNKINIDQLNNRRVKISNDKPIKEEKQIFKDFGKKRVNPNTPWGKVRTEYFNKYGRACSKCKTTINVELHHIIPVSLGGTNELSNIIALCDQCHEAEHSRKFKHDHYENVEHYGTEKRKINPTIQKIINAIKNEKYIQMKYANYNGEVKDRRVFPISINNEKGRIYLRAYCLLRKKIRTFKITRIREFKILNS